MLKPVRKCRASIWHQRKYEALLSVLGCNFKPRHWEKFKIRHHFNRKLCKEGTGKDRLLHLTLILGRWWNSSYLKPFPDLWGTSVNTACLDISEVVNTVLQTGKVPLSTRKLLWAQGNFFKHLKKFVVAFVVLVFLGFFCLVFWLFFLLTVWVTAHWPRLLREIVESPSLWVLSGHGLRQLSLSGWLCLSRSVGPNSLQ